MKKLVGIITVLALFTSVASAELLKNFKANGSIEVLNITADNTSDYNSDAADKRSETKARVIIGATFDLNDDVDAKVTLVKSDRYYGDTVAPQTAAGGTIDAFTFEEAYINMNGVFGLDHRLGRQHYGTPGDLVIYYGPAGWYVEGLGAGSALDGWSSVYKKDKLTIGAVSAKVFEAAGSNAAMNDVDLYGVTANYDLYEYMNPGFYYYQKDDRLVANTLQKKLTVMGVTAKGKFMGFNYGFEYAMNGGSDHNLTATSDMNYKGTLLALNADYALDVPVIGKFVFMGRQVIGSGDKTTGDKDDKKFYAINANFRPGFIAGGLTGAITSPSNLTVTTLGANLTPNKWDGKLNICSKIHNLSYTEDVTWTTVTADAIGTEIDLLLTWNHSDDVALHAYYAMFSPDNDYTKVDTTSLTAKDDMVTLLGLNASVKF